MNSSLKNANSGIIHPPAKHEIRYFEECR